MILGSFGIPTRDDCNLPALDSTGNLLSGGVSCLTYGLRCWPLPSWNWRWCLKGLGGGAFIWSWMQMSAKLIATAHNYNEPTSSSSLRVWVCVAAVDPFVLTEMIFNDFSTFFISQIVVCSLFFAARRRLGLVGSSRNPNRWAWVLILLKLEFNKTKKKMVFPSRSNRRIKLGTHREKSVCFLFRFLFLHHQVVVGTSFRCFYWV